MRLFTDGDTHMAVIETFIDEGGVHSTAPILSVAAFGGTHEKWAEFLAQWKEPNFHACDSTWEKSKGTLADIIDDCGLEAVVTWLKTDDFKKHANTDLKNNLGNAYAICTFACALNICKLARSTSSDVSFVIEQGQPNAEYVERVLNALSEDNTQGIKSVALVQKRSFRQLATADFVAHSRSTSNPWLKRLLDGGGVLESQITAAQLHKISNQVSLLAKRYKYERSKRRRRWRQ